MSENLQVLLNRHPTGTICIDDFQLSTSTMPTVSDGTFLLENHYLSMDAGFRQWMNQGSGDNYLPGMQIGDPVQSMVLGRVITSKNPQFPVNSVVLARSHWEQYSLIDGSDLCTLLQTDPALPLSDYASSLGPTGLTAWFGLQNIGRPQQDETLLVSTAAGAVGNMVCQLGKISGCKVIGITGSPEKQQWLTDILGIDGSINYRVSQPLEQQIRELCPQGIDVYFDNVGGSTLDSVLPQINDRARIVLCGAMSMYEQDNPGPVYNMWQLITHRATAEGFMFSDYADQYPEAITIMTNLIKNKHLSTQVSLYHGIETAPQAFCDLMSGVTTGKCLVQLRP